MPKDFADKIIMFAVIGLVGWAIIGLPILYGHARPLPPPGVVSSCASKIIGVCFVKATAEGKIFGFAEFVPAFALLILIYTVSDVRHRFRVATAPIPIWRLTFWLSAAIGITALATDLWFTRGYLVPWFLASQSYWQMAMGIAFLLMILSWIWFAFVRPPVFGKYNAFNFANALYTYLLQGAERDLPVIAAELGRSARAIVKYVNERPYRGSPAPQRKSHQHNPTASNYAIDILLLMGNRKFCRHIVASSPGTAIAFFQAMSEFRKYRIPIGQFASNLSTEALINKDSILYHEDEGYYSGYFGYVRPFTNALYGNFLLVEALTEGNSPLDIDLDARWAIDAKQLEAYARAVLTTFNSALDEGQFHNHSYALYRAFGCIQHATDDLYKLRKLSEGSESKDIHGRLRAAVDFVNKAIAVLEKHGIERTTYRRHSARHTWHKDYYDYLAELMFEIIASASAIKTRKFVGWTVQYSTIWSQFFNSDDSKTRKIVLFKLRRLLYDEVVHLERGPNFRSAAVLGYLLNVLGVKEGTRRDYRTDKAYPLQKAVISWARRNYLWLVSRQHKVAAAVLLGTISFDAERHQLVKTYREGLSLTAPTDTLDLDQPIGPVRPDDPNNAFKIMLPGE